LSVKRLIVEVRRDGLYRLEIGMKSAEPWTLGRRAIGWSRKLMPVNEALAARNVQQLSLLNP
jgi:hypothetical protein